MTRRAWTHTTFALVLFVSTATAAPSSSVTDRWERSYEVSGSPELDVVTDDARVEIMPWDRPTIALEVSTTGWRIEPGGIRVTAEQDGGAVRLEVREPRVHWSVGWNRRSVRVVARVPRSTRLDVHTGDGAVDIGALLAPVRVVTGDGSIRLAGARGRIELQTGDGRVEARDLDGDLTAHSGDGALTLEGRFRSLRVGTGDGPVHVRAEEGSTVASAWSVESGDGVLALRVPSNLRADLDLQTADGRIDVDVPIEVSGRLSRSHVRGTMNGGGGLLRARSGDGSIRITALESAVTSGS